MPKATLIVRRAAVRPDEIVDTVLLDHAARRGAHAALTTTGGIAFELALERAAVMEDGDGLKLDDGRIVGVKAAEEALLEVRAGNAARLMRLAWQLGGSHVPAEIGADVLYVPESAAELVRGSGCAAQRVRRAFRPEKEAHDHSNCGHDHGHDRHAAHHRHEHDHGADQHQEPKKHSHDAHAHEHHHHDH